MKLAAKITLIAMGAAAFVMLTAPTAEAGVYIDAGGSRNGFHIGFGIRTNTRSGRYYGGNSYYRSKRVHRVDNRRGRDYSRIEEKGYRDGNKQGYREGKQRRRKSYYSRDYQYNSRHSSRYNRYDQEYSNRYYRYNERYGRYSSYREAFHQGYRAGYQGANQRREERRRRYY